MKRSYISIKTLMLIGLTACGGSSSSTPPSPPVNNNVVPTDAVEVNKIYLDELSASEGFVLKPDGNSGGPVIGKSVSGIGDINGDGFADYIIGSQFSYAGSDSVDNNGAAYVVFGTDKGFVKDGAMDKLGRPQLDLINLSSSQGFIIKGKSLSLLGSSVSSAGDVNGDGFMDIVVGAPSFETEGEGYVIFGTDQGFGATVDGQQVIDVATMNAAQGFTIKGSVTLGKSVSSSKVNADQFDDILILGEDKLYVIYGSDQGFGNDVAEQQILDVSTLSQDQGFAIEGLNISVASGGDFNGDGISDIIAENSQDGAKQAFIIFGTHQDSGTRKAIDVANLDATQGLVIQGIGRILSDNGALSYAGDINGDGFDDVLIGNSGGDIGGYRAGEVYVVFGTNLEIGTNVNGRQVIDVTELNPEQGFMIQGDETGVEAACCNTGLGTSFNEGDYTGFGVSTLGDINNDGFDEFMFSAPGGDDTYDIAGEIYIIYGSDQEFGSLDNTGRRVLDLTFLKPDEGLMIIGGLRSDRIGRSLTSVDIDNDGLNDLIFGNGGRSQFAGPHVGGGYVIFGSKVVSEIQ